MRHRVAQARRAVINAAQRTQPIDHRLVYYYAFGGQFSDNPRAIYEHLAGRAADLDHVWRLAPKHASSFPADVKTVRPGGWPHARAMARARYVITNTWVNLPKARGTTWLQTWHGTPLKRIAFDTVRPLSREDEQTMSADIANWDYLLSPNSFSTEIFRSAFRYDGPILETGYPRNDILRSPRAGALRREVRDSLGLVDGQRAILYAPTWRDGASGPQSLPLELDAMAAELGGDHVLLLRHHRGTVADDGATRHPFVVDVTSYPDIRYLYLAADVLVTDYSSVMFDFAITGRPMVFYAYDLDDYRERIRGFCFDFEAEVPGPIVDTPEQLTAALLTVDQTAPGCDERYRRFRERYCQHDDGHATRRVVEAVFDLERRR